jgi:HEAT repeat protein
MEKCGADDTGDRFRIIMNEILQWLSGGDLRSDGMSDQAAKFILEHPQLLDELFDGLKSGEDLIRGRTADALEKVARSKPELFLGYLPDLLHIAKVDQVPMVKMHLAMLFGHLVVCDVDIEEILSALLDLLNDESAFVKSWSIVSLCIIGKRHPKYSKDIFEDIARLHDDSSVAIRTRGKKALELLGNEDVKFPKGWIKSIHLQDL